MSMGFRLGHRLQPALGMALGAEVGKVLEDRLAEEFECLEQELPQLSYGLEPRCHADWRVPLPDELSFA